MIHTASPDDFLRSQGIPSYFRALLANLREQSFERFELVYVDRFHEANRQAFREMAGGEDFLVKHVPVHPAHRYWYDRGHCYISAAKNTGILYADGELCVTCDDAEFFPSELLGLYWQHYQQGRLMHALHRRMRSIRTESGFPTGPVDGDVYVDDYRWEKLGDRPSWEHHHGSMLYAGTSFALDDALALNGFNERLDGYKGVEDADFGIRLQHLGRSFVMDAKGHLFIVDHPSYTDLGGDCEPAPPTAFLAVENYGMLLCATELSEPVANRLPITPRHLRIIQRETLKYRHFDPLGPANAERLATWLRTPTFDLGAQRDELRRSLTWEW